MTPDAVHEDIAWPSRDEGAAQIKKFMREMIENRRVSGRGVSVAVIENGRIKRFSDYYDFASVFRNPPADSPRTNK